MFEKLSFLEEQFEELAKKISDPEVIADQETWRKLCKEHSDLTPIVEKYREYKKNMETIEDANALMDDPDTDKEFKEMLVDESKTAKANIEKIVKNKYNLSVKRYFSNNEIKEEDCHIGIAPSMLANFSIFFAGLK